MEKLPCETIVWDLLPAIRAVIAVEMVKQGLSQKMVANLLNMAPSAVSQYLSGKRGYRISFTPEVSEAIAQLSSDLVKGKVTDPRERICGICLLMRGGDALCSACTVPDEEKNHEINAP
ncbi:transcriptional regulator [Methanospirillum stamsii]|uniref:transcriptional regulator n=1 Tax=Methanospirillum stamsii TaxID=1277351 RepID=UPI0015E862DD|nr:helix-turn-helix domain-containing protein [Methanospirillum stamsii]